MYVYFYNKTVSWLVNDRLKLKISSKASLTFSHAVKGLSITSSQHEISLEIIDNYQMFIYF